MGGERRKLFGPTWHKWLPRSNGWVAIFELTYIPICLFIFFIITRGYYGSFSLALAAASTEGCTMRLVSSFSQKVLRVSGPGKDISRPAEASLSSFPKEQDLNPDAPVQRRLALEAQNDVQI